MSTAVKKEILLYLKDHLYGNLAKSIQMTRNSPISAALRMSITDLIYISQLLIRHRSL